MRSRLCNSSSLLPLSSPGVSARCFLSTSAALQATAYETMLLPQGATHQEIKEQFYELSRKYHPDAKTPDASADRFKALSEAYSLIGDEEKRSAYDASLSSSSQSSRRSRRRPPRPTYGTNNEGTFGTRTSAGSRAWQYDSRAKTMAQEAQEAANRRAAQFSAAQGAASGIGRTYHHYGQSAGDYATETARAQEYERRHAVLGMRLRGGHADGKSSAVMGGSGDWNKAVPIAFTLLSMLSLGALLTRKSGGRESLRARAEEA